MNPATKTHLAPTRIAPETFVIHDHNGEGVAPVMVPLNTMVSRGAEPVVVDTGVIENRDQFLADVFSIVEPEDIRWVFISHDDVDHTGNLTPLVEAARNATVVVNWFTWERMGATLEVPLDRMRWVDDGGAFAVGDRVLARGAPAGVRLAHDPWPVRPEDGRTSARSTGSRAWACGPSPAATPPP